MYPVSRDVQSDRDGGFRFAGVSGGKYTVSTQLRGHSTFDSEKVNVVDGVVRDGIVLTLPTGKTITGTLRCSDRREFKLGTVRLEASRKGEATVICAVGADGKFRFAGLKDMEYRIALWHSRGLDGWTLVPVRGVRAGTTDLRLELVRAGRVAGRVVGPDDKPLRARVWFEAEGEDGAATVHTTDAEGRFEWMFRRAFAARSSRRGRVAERCRSRSRSRASSPVRPTSSSAWCCATCSVT